MRSPPGDPATEGSYDCIDRIVLNAYFRLGHSPGGFRQWWRQLTGSDETLDNAHLMRLAGRFSRRVRGWARAHQVPVIDYSPGDRKHEIAEEHLKNTRVTRGVFLILVGRAQAPVWDIRPQHHLERKKPLPYVHHYSFHLLDPDWGHVTIKISGHPPFPAQVILNGHEYVACRARRSGIHLILDPDGKIIFRAQGGSPENIERIRYYLLRGLERKSLSDAKGGKQK